MTENLDDRINKLLSFTPTPTSKDKYADTRLTNPVGSVRRKLDKGAFDPRCKLALGPGLEYYHSYYNLENVEITENSTITHKYGEFSIDRYPVGIVVLHSHTALQYCPWKGGCHVQLSYWPEPDGEYPVGYRMADKPKWFQNIWKDVYESSS